MKELKLKDNNPDKYIIVKLADGIMFVHDKESGKNFFTQKAVAEVTGLNIRTVSYHLNEYKARKSNSNNIGISLEVFNSDKPVRFYPFAALSYVAHRANTPEAIEYCDYLEEAIDEKFNKDTGFTKSIEPSREDKILLRAKKQQAKNKNRNR